MRATTLPIALVLVSTVLMPVVGVFGVVTAQEDSETDDGQSWTVNATVSPSPTPTASPTRTPTATSTATPTASPTQTDSQPESSSESQKSTETATETASSSSINTSNLTSYVPEWLMPSASKPDRNVESLHYQLSEDEGVVIKRIVWLDNGQAVIHLRAESATRVGVVDIEEMSEEGEWHIQVLTVPSGESKHVVSLKQDGGDMTMSLQVEGEKSGFTTSNPAESFLDNVDSIDLLLGSFGGGIFALGGAAVYARDRRQRRNDSWTVE